MQARVLRLRDAPRYLGMDKNQFNKVVRPNIQEIRIGTQGIAFDRLDLDVWFDQYKARNRRPVVTLEGDQLWGVKNHQDCSNESVAPGTLTRKCTDKEFAAALERAT